MLPFKPNKEYKTISLYVGAVCAIIITLALLLFRFSAVREGFSLFISALSPVLFGAVFAYLLRPLVRRLETLFHRFIKRRGPACFLAILISYAIVFAVIFAFIFLVIPALLGDTGDLGQKLTQLLGQSQSFIDQLIVTFNLPADTFEKIVQTLYGMVDNLTQILISFTSSAVATLFDILLGLLLSGAFLYHRAHISATMRRFCIALFSVRFNRFLSRVVSYSDHTFGRYLIGKIVEALIVGVIYLILLPLIGMPFPYLITVIMVITNFIPIIGGFLGGIPCAILILTVDPIMTIWFVIICLTMEQIDGNIIIPKLIGSILGLRAVCIITAVALFGGLFGILGMFLAAPLFSILYMIIQDAVNTRLLRKGHSLSLSEYESLFSTHASPRRKFHFHALHAKYESRETHENDEND